jgi:hypothetical protein
VHIGPKKLKLDEETRWQIAREAVEEPRRYGGWKELDEEAPMRPLRSRFYRVLTWLLPARLNARI